MKKFAILLILIPSLLGAQPKVTTLNAYLETSLKDWGVPGMSVAIVKDGEVILAKGYGVKQAGKPEAADENTLFAIASNTKAFISAALATLVQEGKISWDDKVRKYIPTFELYHPYVSSEVTIRDLLSHRVGIGTFSGDFMWYKSILDVPQLIDQLKYLPQSFPFRSGFGYSNLMYITAGEVIKQVTGQEWYEYVQLTFFDPLEMNRTITSISELESKGNYAMPHKPFEDGNIVIPWVDWDNMSAAGGIISSAADMSKWMIMQLSDGISANDTILKKDQKNEMWTIHNNFTLSENSKKSIPGRHFTGYGLGWGLGDYHGNMIASHSGGYDGMYSRVMLVPDQNLGIAILTNTMKGNTLPLCYYILNQYIGKDMRDWSREWLERSNAYSSTPNRVEVIKSSQVKKTKPSVSNDALVGTYWSGMHGKVMITKADKNLRLTFENAPALSATLKHWHYDTWEIVWDEEHAWFDFGTVQFLVDNALEVNGLHFDVPNNDIFFDELDLTKIK